MVKVAEMLTQFGIIVPELDRTPTTVARLAYLELRNKEIDAKKFRFKAEEIYWSLRDNWIADFGLQLAAAIDLTQPGYKAAILAEIEEVAPDYAASIELTDDPENDREVLGFCIAIILLDAEPEDHAAFPWADHEIVNYVAKKRQIDQNNTALSATSERPKPKRQKRKETIQKALFDLNG